MEAPLELSSAQAVADWLGEPGTVDAVLVQSLEAARELVTAAVSLPRLGDHLAGGGALPASLHRFTMMQAAQLHRRQRSIFGVDQFSAGEESPVLLIEDPTMRKLIAPWLAPAVAGAPAPTGQTA